MSDATTVELSKADARRLAEIVQATRSEVGHTFANPKTLKKLAAAGFVEIHEGATNPENADERAVRASEAGQAHFDAGAVAAALQAPSNRSAAPTAGEFEIISEPLELPTPTARGRSSGYPFEKLGIKESFFVPKTDTRPDPVKSLSSTISGTNKKFKDLGQPNKFRHGPFVRNGVEGALVVREA